MVGAVLEFRLHCVVGAVLEFRLHCVVGAVLVAFLRCVGVHLQNPPANGKQGLIPE